MNMGEQDVQVIYHLSTVDIIRKILKKSREYAQRKKNVFVECAQIGAWWFYSKIAQKSLLVIVDFVLFVD